ncbi:MAG TPA: sulfite exporter TauE/SafE family protein [Candidatus Obscuribacterales bacterium]
MNIDALIIAVACLSAAVSAVAGFGIGSLLTPVAALALGTKLAVAAVAIPHFFGISMRCWMLRSKINYKILGTFGVMSAVGSMAGACLHNCIDGFILTVIFVSVLVLAVASACTKWHHHIHLTKGASWVAGCISGTLGGLVGNHGGVQAASLLGLYEIDRDAFVATVTAIGVMSDIARVPIYIYNDAAALLKIWPLIAACSVAVLCGTFMGVGILRHIPQHAFKRIVVILVLVLGLTAVIQKSDALHLPIILCWQ